MIVSKSYQDSTGPLGLEFIGDPLQQAGSNQWQGPLTVHCPPWHGHFFCHPFLCSPLDQYCLHSVRAWAVLDACGTQESGRQLVEGTSRQQGDIHSTPIFPTLDNHNTHSTVEGGVILETLGRVNTLIGKLLTNWKKGRKTMKVCFWRVALEQQSKPKIKTKKWNSSKIKIKAKQAKRVLITFQLQVWLSGIRFQSRITQSFPLTTIFFF